MDYTTILNIDIQNLSQSYLLEHLKQGVLFTPNVDHIVKLQKDKEFYDCYQNADWVICDSRILFFALISSISLGRHQFLVLICFRLFTHTIKMIRIAVSLF